MVSSYCHLGHLVASIRDDNLDIIGLQSRFIGQVNSMLCFFGKVSSNIKLCLFRSYCTSYFYGYELWNLLCLQLAKWQTSV